MSGMFVDYINLVEDGDRRCMLCALTMGISNSIAGQYA